MICLGQLLDVLDDNERITLRSSHERPLVYLEDIPKTEAKSLLTKEARQCAVSHVYSDNSERCSRETVTVIYIKPNGYFILNGEVDK